MELRIGQKLFEALQNVCDFTALESDMQQILSAVEEDNGLKNSCLDGVSNECPTCGVKDSSDVQCPFGNCINAY